MYFYEIGYGSYEESEYATYTHEKKFTPEQLEKLVHQAIKKAFWPVFNEMAKNSDGSVPWRFNKQKKEYLELCLNFAALLNERNRDQDSTVTFFDRELVKLGFKRLKYDAEVVFFGWKSVLRKGWEKDVGPHQEKLRLELKKMVAKKYPQLVNCYCRKIGET
jgi:hypothetical protein